LFKTSNVLTWLSRNKEKQVLRLCEQHFDKILETVRGMKRVVDAFCTDEYTAVETYYKTTFDAEREADDIKHRVLRDVSSGPIHPIDREEVVRLVLTCDDIAENAKSAAGKLRLASSGMLTDEFRVYLQGMADRCVEIVEHVGEALHELSKNLKVAIDTANQVEILEENIDEYHLGLLKLLMNCDGHMQKFGQWILLLNAIENMEEVADRSEDVGDVIRSIAILG